ncbi:splicing factor 3A subunit 3 [Vanessa tameamea]|uniref:Splicing factor 3A subunit 3 n=1 Tax=Vanessa tameamea TaxID=334116 RepID=A0A8B8HKF3_VANTA|nr:splicing factor 3A subunit 3 [Vanessa tameamea]XP_047531627.1 splicing factor 3A subunit 3 [Vanessa atalanta]XP_047531628.1 splicing factor 3A subunit 3 [Vanessa atalanta]
METILEQQRSYHEERERTMDAMVKEILHKKTGHRETINADHRLKNLHERYIESTIRLKELYEDKDGLRKEEIAALSGPNEFQEFYARLKQIKEFHRKHPNEICVPMSVEFEELAKIRENPAEDYTTPVEFTDEEGYGKYLDLHECYEKYINLKGIEKVDYITYLSIFDHLFDIPRERKNSEYRNYIRALLTYLKDFVSRIKPLLDQAQEMAIAHQEFIKQWEAGSFPGWPKETGGALTNVGAHLDLSAFFSWEELASLGLDRLKSALMALGLKCGGTLEERAQRLFSTKGQTALDKSLVAKKGANKAKASTLQRHKDIAAIEGQVYRFANIVSGTRAATIENVTRRAARAAGERRDESDEESDASVAADADSDDDEVPYNPKNLPLGWDGKPIPYWLYKLHGLNISYSCEICGNYTYKGPKAFQRHFAEWRHAHGMRCLGIPNTAHFANVTQIEDALALWEKIKNQKENERFVAENDEEFEDSQGNVVNRKTFEDLKRQGLL